MPKIIFTNEQVEEMRDLRSKPGWTWEKIGRRFGVSHNIARSAVDPEYAKVRNDRNKRYSQARREKAKAGLIGSSAAFDMTGVPQSVENDRQRRLNAPYRSPAAALLGDPPIGFSALDRKMAGVGA